jgi:hypothetical protein
MATNRLKERSKTLYFGDRILMGYSLLKERTVDGVQK